MNLRCLVQLLMLLLLAASSAYAGSPVYKVSKGENHIFIGGTIHLLARSDYPLPPGFEAAYGQSAQLVFETDMQKMKSAEIQQLILKKVMYPDGKNLKQVLNKQTFAELEKHLSSRGIPVNNILRFKPGMLSVTLTVIELQKMGLAGTGVDDFYSLKALNDNKKLGQLEAIEEQIDFIATMGDGYENELITSTLRDIKILPGMLGAMKEAWRKNDEKKLEELFLQPMRNETPGAYDKLIVKRNNAWMPRLEEMLKSKEVEFVLVGALHLVGNDGILAKLAAKGYTLQMMD